jgi:hypothetical protein
MNTPTQLLTQRQCLTVEERRTAATWQAQLDSYSEELKLPHSPLLAIRTQDLLMTLLLVHRAERALDAEGFYTPDKTPIPALDCIGRARERLRKALREFEDYCNRQTENARRNTPPPQYCTPAPTPPPPPLTKEERAEELRRIAEGNARRREESQLHSEAWERKHTPLEDWYQPGNLALKKELLAKANQPPEEPTPPPPTPRYTGPPV